jgi:hypothetical protein
MTAFAGLPAVHPLPARRLRPRPAAWARLLARLRPAHHDDSLRAGDERPAPPMVVSVNFGGAARLR